MMSSPAQKNGPLFSPGFQKQKEQILYNISEINKNTKKLKENDKVPEKRYTIKFVTWIIFFI